MPVRIIVENAKKLSDSIWTANLHQSDLAVLSSARSKTGEMNILYLPSTEKPNGGLEELLLNPIDIVFLNFGTSSNALIIFGEKEGVSHDHKPSGNYHGDDDLFSKDILKLPKPLQDVGNELVSRIRKSFPGYFIKSTNGRYVNQPDNFWTIKIQPNDQSLALTVRGKSLEFGGAGEIDVLDDRPGFSRFKLKEYRQLESAIKIINKSGNR